jgi:hypothetical protein
MSKYISIQEVVRDFLSEKGDFTDHDYLRYLKIAMRGFGNLNTHTLKSFKTVRLELNPLNQAELPADYINWSRIGVLDNGRIISLDVNEDLLIGDVANEIPYVIHEGQYVIHTESQEE